MENLECAIKEIKKNMPELEILENEPMSRHCSFKIGGPVRAFAAPQNEQELKTLCRILASEHTGAMVLGNGSNILFPDEGLKDLIIISTEKLDGLELMDEERIYAGAGISLSRLAGFAMQNGLAGLEFASGIPGTLGGGCIMNAGAYGGELCGCIESVKCYEPKTGKITELSNAQCEFKYRGSIFKNNPDYIILSAVLKLQKGDKTEISEKIKELNAKRREKQPLDLPSAGSAFKRPEGYFAAALIDEAGLKGFSVGGAQISTKHAGFVVNTGNATARDVQSLLKTVQEKVFDKSGVRIEPEVIILPSDYSAEY